MPKSTFTKPFFSVLLLFLFFNFYFLTSVFAQNKTADIDFSLQLCEDNTVFSIEKLEELGNNCFKKISLQELNEKKYEKKIWLKVTVNNRSKKHLNFDDNIDSIKVHHEGKTFLSGYSVARSEKELPYSINISVVNIPVYQKPFYVEITSSRNYPISTDLEVLMDTEFYFKYIEGRVKGIYFQLIFQGMMWIILLYNFFLYLSTKERVYLSYSIYIFGFSVFSLQNSGLLVDFFLYDNPEWSLLFRMVSLAIISVSLPAFILTFLPKRSVNNFWRYSLYGIMIYSVLVLIPYLIINYGFGNSFLYNAISKVSFSVVLLFVLIFMGYLILNKWSGVLVKYFLVGSFMVIGVAFYANTIKVIYGDQIGNVYVYVQVGVILEILIFSLGLGQRMNKLERKNAKILRDQNKILEKKVNERTQEVTLQKDYINSQNEQLKLSNTQFTDSVRYAQTIQEAILPFGKRLTSNFDEYFVFFRPRDIVSGDFYWIYETKDSLTNEDIVLIAVLDCTGHGVPGAFISIIGFALLNEIVSKDNISNPGKILKRLDERLQESLKQDRSNNMDGMDAALCAIKKIPKANPADIQQFDVTFSGAKRPCYYIKDGTIDELKGNRMSVGGITKKKLRVGVEFEEEKIILSSGDKIYLTSDGFADQNGISKKKIGTKRMVRAFDKFQHFPLSEQKIQLEGFLNNHQQEQKQRDDITILGVKL